MRSSKCRSVSTGSRCYSRAAVIRAFLGEAKSGLTRRVIVLALLSVANMGAIHASNENTLERLEIIASEPEQVTGDVILDEHTGSTSRIHRENIERSATQLGELLSSQAGLQQRQTGGFGSFSSISLRAAGGAQVGVYLDGILLNSSGNPVIDLSALEILNLGAVDIYRGVTPLQLGHGSIGGAINLLSIGNVKGFAARDGAESQTRFRLGTGSFSQAGLQLSSQGASGAWDWTGSISRQQSDNNFPFLNDNTTPLNITDDFREPRFNNQVQRSSALLKTSYRQSQTRRTDAILQIADRKLGVPEWRNRQPNQASFDSQSTQLQLSQLVDQWHSWNTRHSVYWHQFNTDFDDSRGQVQMVEQLIQTDTRTLGAKTYWERFTDFGTLGVSVGLRQEDLESQDRITQGNDFSASRYSLLGTAHLAWIDDTDKWLVSPAIRWQQSERDGNSTSFAINQNLQQTSESDLGLQLGVSYRATHQITLSTNLGRFFREPSFGELYGSIGLINGNPSLIPEEGNNLDIGVKYQQNSFSIEATAFHNQRDELIATTFNSQGIGRPGNTGKAFVNGVELSAQWQPHKHWQLQINATLQNPRNKNRFTGFENRILPGEARQLYFSRLTYKPSAFSVWYEWSSNQQRFYDTANILPAEDTSVHDIGMNWSDKNWQISTRIHNLSDDNVEDFNGFAKPGRSWSLAVTRTL